MISEVLADEDATDPDATGAVLASTGSDAATLAALGLAVMVIGGSLIVVGRRNARSDSSPVEPTL